MGCCQMPIPGVYINNYHPKTMSRCLSRILVEGFVSINFLSQSSICEVNKPSKLIIVQRFLVHFN